MDNYILKNESTFICEYTDADIKKALEYIEAFTNCRDCAFYKKCKGRCVITATLTLINRLQTENEDKDILLNHQGEVIKTLEQACREQMAENKRLSTLVELGSMRANDYRVMRDRALKAEKEIERLEAENKKLQANNWEVCDRFGFYAFLKAEAYKECIEKAKKELAPFVVNVSDVCEVLDNLLKENEIKKQEE